MKDFEIKIKSDGVVLMQKRYKDLKIKDLDNINKDLKLKLF